MLQFELQTDLAQAVPEEIIFNFDELKRELSERLEYYHDLVVTEDTIKESKADRATLNKLRTAIDTRRKDIKAAYLRPYNIFEAKCKELTVLIDEPIKAIDTQLKAFDDARKEEKRQQIEAAYENIVKEEYKEIIPLERLFDQRWLNVSTSMATVMTALEDQNTRVEADLLALGTVEEEYKLAVRQKYIETLNVSAAIAHRDALKAARDAFKATETQRTQEEEKRATGPEIAPESETPKAEPVHALRLEFQVTRTQAIALKTYLDNNRIQYRKI